jgi:hypothetical protein
VTLNERIIKRLRIEVMLACGHVIRTRNRPFTHLVKFSCWAGAGCGHAVPWRKVKDTQRGVEDLNYRMPEWHHPTEEMKND